VRKLAEHLHNQALCMEQSCFDRPLRLTCRRLQSWHALHTYQLCSKSTTTPFQGKLILVPLIVPFQKVGRREQLRFLPNRLHSPALLALPLGGRLRGDKLDLINTLTFGWNTNDQSHNGGDYSPCGHSQARISLSQATVFMMWPSASPPAVLTAFPTWCLRIF
jgi:hypothetical protein